MRKKKVVLSYVLPCLLIMALLSLSLLIQKKMSENAPVEEQEWSGMDESIIEKYAEECGRAPSEPLIPVETGDLLLFLFAVGGFTSGAILGYNWRRLFAEREYSRPA